MPAQDRGKGDEHLPQFTFFYLLIAGQRYCNNWKYNGKEYHTLWWV